MSFYEKKDGKLVRITDDTFQPTANGWFIDGDGVPITDPTAAIVLLEFEPEVEVSFSTLLAGVP
jgi:hypothetical protein